MPIYEYKCQSCGQISEFLIKTMSPDTVYVCPNCGSKELEKLFSTPSILKTQSPSSGQTCCGRSERCQTPPCSTGGTCRRNQ